MRGVMRFISMGNQTTGILLLFKNNKPQHSSKRILYDQTKPNITFSFCCCLRIAYLRVYTTDFILWFQAVYYRFIYYVIDPDMPDICPCVDPHTQLQLRPRKVCQTVTFIQSPSSPPSNPTALVIGSSEHPEELCGYQEMKVQP